MMWCEASCEAWCKAWCEASCEVEGPHHHDLGALARVALLDEHLDRAVEHERVAHVAPLARAREGVAAVRVHDLLHHLREHARLRASARARTR
eukprot:3090240-Prymnesium_polylepis.3